MITNVADLLYPTYNAILNYMPFSDVAFRAKMLTGQIPGWRGIPDEEVPFAQYPIAIVDPPFQEVSLDDFASVTGVLSKKTATNPGVGIVSYEWEWGDGSTSTGVSVTHKYTSIGDFAGTLTVTDSNGLTDKALFHVRVTSEKTYRTLYAITEAMELAVTFDDGWNWRVYNLRSWKQLIGMRGRAVAVHPDNRLMAWFGDNTGRIWYTTDGLLSVPDPLAILPTGIVDIAVEPYTGSNLLVLCEDGFLYVVPTTTYTDTIVVKQLIHLDGVPVAVSISDANSNLWAAAAGTKYYISRNYGQTWNAYDVPGGVSITAMDFSRMSRKYLSIATQKSAFVIDVDTGNVVKGLSNVQVPVIGISNLPRSVDGVVVALGEPANQATGTGALTVQNIYKSDPFGTINTTAVFPVGPPYAKNLLADRASQNKFWYTYNYEIFKSYAISSSSYPTSSLIELGTFVIDIAQGPLINSYDNFDFPTPTFPFPKFPIPEFPTIDVPPFNFPPLYFPIPPFYIPPFYPCYDIDGNYDCLPPPYEIPPGYYEPYAPGFPPIYPPNGPGWPTLPEIPIGPLDPPFPPIIPWGDPGEDPRDDVWNVFCETGVSGAEFITDGHPDWVGAGPSGGGYLKMTSSHIESLWPPAGYSGTDKVNCWMKISDPGPNNFWQVCGWKLSGCDAPIMMGLYVSRTSGLPWNGKLVTSLILPLYRIPDDGLPARQFAPPQASFGPENTAEGPGGMFWPVIRALGGTFNYFRGPHWIGQFNTLIAIEFDANKWYRWSMRHVNETVFFRVDTAAGNAVEDQYWFRDYDLRYTPGGTWAPGAWLAKLMDNRNLVSFWGSPRKNLYSDPVPDRGGQDSALFRNHAVDDEHDPVQIYIDNPAFGYTGPLPHDPDDPLPPQTVPFAFYLGNPETMGTHLVLRS